MPHNLDYATIDPTSTNVAIHPWDNGPAVVVLQELLNAHGYKLRIDGDFGHITEAAVLSFQGKQRLLMDGVVGPKTWALLQSTLKPGSRTAHIGNRGEDIRRLQSMLQIQGYRLQCDGVFGEQTQQAILQFQERHRLRRTGIVDNTTWTMLWGKPPLPNPPEQTGWFYNQRRWW